MRKMITILGLLLSVAVFAGCAQTPEQRSAELQKLVDFNNQIHAGIVATTQAAPAIDASIAALPEGKSKTEAQKASSQIQQHLQSAAQLSEGVGKVLVAGQSGDAVATGAAVSGALSSVPGIGPYAALAGLLITAGFGVFKSVSAAKAQAAAAAAESQAQAHLEAAQKAQTDLKKVVQSIDVAGVTALLSAEQKETIKKIQGPDTSAMVEQIKTGG